jgi:hypothetical protein
MLHSVNSTPGEAALGSRRIESIVKTMPRVRDKQMEVDLKEILANTRRRTPAVRRPARDHSIFFNVPARVWATPVSKKDVIYHDLNIYSCED